MPTHGTTDLHELLADPKTVGQSEYAALHELLVDGTSDLDGRERLDMARGMLDETLEHAAALKRTLDAAAGEPGQRRPLMISLAELLAAHGFADGWPAVGRIAQALEDSIDRHDDNRSANDDYSSEDLERMAAADELSRRLIAAICGPPLPGRPTTDGPLHLTFTGAGHARIDEDEFADGIEALTDDTTIPDPGAHDPDEGAQMAFFLEEAARRGVLNLPEGLTLHVIGDDDAESGGIVLELGNDQPGQQWYATTGWNNLTEFWPPRNDDDDWDTFEQEQLARVALTTAVGEINTILVAAGAAPLNEAAA